MNDGVLRAGFLVVWVASGIAAGLLTDRRVRSPGWIVVAAVVGPFAFLAAREAGDVGPPTDRPGRLLEGSLAEGVHVLIATADPDRVAPVAHQVCRAFGSNLARLSVACVDGDDAGGAGTSVATALTGERATVWRRAAAEVVEPGVPAVDGVWHADGPRAALDLARRVGYDLLVVAVAAEPDSRAAASRIAGEVGGVDDPAVLLVST